MREGDSILLVRHEKNGASYWLLPGGGVEFGETLDEALRREMREETELEVRVGDLVFACDSIAPDGSRHLVSLCFAADVVGGELGAGIDESVVEARYVDREGLGELTLHPDLSDELRDGLLNGFGQSSVYLGARWTQGN